MEENHPTHLLIRFSDNLFSVGDVISLHQQVIKEKGSVWFGKLGNPIAQRHIDRINMQCQNKIPSFLFLVKGNRRKSTFYRTRIERLSSSPPKNDKELIPKYYSDLKILKRMKFWAKLSDIKPIDESEIQNIQVIGSVLEIGETLVRSSSGHFLVRETSR